MKIQLSIAAGVLLVASAVIAQPSSVQSVAGMLPSCRAIKQTAPGVVNMGDGGQLCWGAFLVMQKGINLMGADRKMLWDTCSPEESTTFQLVSIFIQYADQRPQRWHEDFTWFALESLQKAFPCAPGPRRSK